ncbi:hypothetical protein HDU89_008976 [Geranomyces variabilis]|nr:hypothetical protein HDU89_008976 [Geranomyces variabilis]
MSRHNQPLVNIDIKGIGKAYPPEVLARDQYLDLLAARVKPCANLTKLMAVVKTSHIETRHAIIPCDHEMFARSTVPSIQELNDLFSEEAPKLSLAAAHAAIEDWGGDTETISHIVTGTVTGVMNPGLDYYMQQGLKLSPMVERYNLSGVGCAGGLATLRLAINLATARPGAKILVVCCELCTLYGAQRFFRCTDDAPLDVAAALFGDGASALIIESTAVDPTRSGRVTPPARAEEDYIFRIVDYAVSTHPTSVNDLGFQLENDGYKILLTRNVPRLGAETLPPLVHKLLSAIPVPPAVTSIPFLIHPGGPAVLQVIEQSFGLDRWQTTASWDVLAKRGNTSSATIFAVMDAFRNAPPEKEQVNGDGYAVAAAFGPGVTTECVLLQMGARTGFARRH